MSCLALTYVLNNLTHLVTRISSCTRPAQTLYHGNANYFLLVDRHLTLCESGSPSATEKAFPSSSLRGKGSSLRGVTALLACRSLALSRRSFAYFLAYRSVILSLTAPPRERLSSLNSCGFKLFFRLASLDFGWLFEDSKLTRAVEMDEELGADDEGEKDEMRICSTVQWEKTQRSKVLERSFRAKTESREKKFRGPR